MSKGKTGKALALILGVLTMSILLSYLVLAWTEPSGPPPTGNVPAPINVGTTAQYKQGDLGANVFRDTDNYDYYLDPASSGISALFRGNVGIGTTSPTSKLYVKTTDTTTVPFQVEALAQVQPLPGWTFRKPLTISNTGSALTNYQALVILDTQSLISAGKMRSDCYDIRFTASDGTTLLNYWIEAGCNTASTRIWVKVPSIPENSETKIYMYYGNSGASKGSNGEATFEFFDDFDSVNTAKFTYGEAYGGYNPIFYEVSGGMLREWSDDNRRILRMKKDFGPADKVIVRTRFETSGSCSWNQNWLVQSGNVNRNVFGWWMAGSDRDFYVVTRVDGGVWFEHGITTIPVNTWYLDEIIKKSSTDFEAKVYYDNGTQVGSSYSKSNAGWADETWTWVSLQYHNVNVYYDWILVRKYASPEPTISVGAEEIPTQQQTVFYIQNSTGNVGIGTTSPTQKLDVDGNTRIQGNLTVTGTKSAIVNTSQGERKMSAVEAPTANFVTAGSSKLANGKVELKTEPLFLETINTDVGYQVLLTPTDNCQLYVSEKKSDGFVVKLSNGKDDCTFDWFLYGVRKGYEDWYMEE